MTFNDKLEHLDKQLKELRKDRKIRDERNRLKGIYCE